jgi:hypothetical protein
MKKKPKAETPFQKPASAPKTFMQLVDTHARSQAQKNRKKK